MKKYSVKSFYPASVVDVASELYYLCELGRYLKSKGSILSLEGVILSKSLKKSYFWDYLRYSIENGYITDVNIPENQLVIDDIDSLSLNKIYTLDLSLEENKPRFKVDGTVLSWDLFGESPEDTTHNCRTISGTLSSQAIVSLIAYVAVERLFNGGVDRLNIIMCQELCRASKAVDLILLMLKTDAIPWVRVEFLDKDIDISHLTYEAWCYEYSQKGYLSSFIPVETKKKFFADSGFKEGDVVFLYKRGSKSDMVGTSPNSLVKPIRDCNIAVIRSVTANNISFETISTKTTTLGALKRFESFSPEVQELYVGSSYLDFVTRIETLSWLDVGIDYMMYSEEYFMSGVSDKTDSVVLWVTDGVREDQVELDCKNGVYWILKDRNVDFDEKLFLEKNFPNEEPDYVRYMRGEVLETTLYTDKSAC